MGIVFLATILVRSIYSKTRLLKYDNIRTWYDVALITNKLGRANVSMATEFAISVEPVHPN